MKHSTQGRIASLGFRRFLIITFVCVCWIRSKSCFLVDFDHKATRLGKIRSLGSSDGNSKRIRTFERLVDALMFEMHFRNTLDASLHKVLSGLANLP